MSAKTIFARSSVAGLAIAAFVAMPAMAADVIYQEPPAPAAPPMTFDPVSTWAGPYAGISAGYGFGGRTTIEDDANTINTRGWMGGVFGGYNFQQGMAVYGIEGDVNYSRLSGSNADTSSRTSLDGSLRGRLGAAVTDDILIYGTAGVAAERQRVTDDLTGDRDSNMMLGYTVGAGTDIKLTDQVFGRLEYRYTDYGSKSFDSVGGSDVDTRNNRVSVGLGVKF
jgi:outer membrane immunogenic protein